MEPNRVNETDRRSLGFVVRELATSMSNVMRSEIHLAKAEMGNTAGQVGRHLAQGIAFGVFAALGIFPMLAFFVIGLGRILNDNYWLSSLIVAVVCMAVGGALALRAYLKMKEYDLTLPQTRHSLEHEYGVVDRKIHDITEASKRRAA